MIARDTLKQSKKNVRYETGKNRRYIYGNEYEKVLIIEKADKDAKTLHENTIQSLQKEYELKKRELEQQKAQFEKKKVRHSSPINKKTNEPMGLFKGFFNGKETKVKACGPIPMSANKYSLLVTK